MNAEVLTVPEDMALPDLARYLLEHEISGAPVVDRDGKVVGVVSLADIVAADADADADAEADRRPGETASSGGFYDRGWDDSDEEGHLVRADLADLEDCEEAEWEELEVADIMTEEVYSVAEDAPVSEIASTMLRHHVHRLLVARDGQAVGIISTSDLLGLLVDES
jgi:CBS domain-containing protein